jgi:hypothetical protein
MMPGDEFTLTREERQHLIERRKQREEGAEDLEDGGRDEATGKSDRQLTKADVEAAVESAATKAAKEVEQSRQKKEAEQAREKQRELARQTVRERAGKDERFAKLMEKSPNAMKRVEWEIGDALEADKETVAKLSTDQWLQRLAEETDKAVAKIKSESSELAGLSDEEAAARLKGRNTGTGGSGQGKSTGTGDDTEVEFPEEIDYGNQDPDFVYPSTAQINARHEKRFAAFKKKQKAST